MFIESVMPSNHLVLCRPLLLLSSIFPSIRVFSNESVLCIRWPKYWRSSFSISPSNEYSGLISLRIDWFDLLAVQGTLKSLLQHHSTKAQHQGYIEMFGDRILKTWWLSKIIVLSYSFRMYLMKVGGEGNGTPLQYSCLENPMDGGAW